MKISDALLIKKYIGRYNIQFGLVIILSIICAFFEIINIGALVPLLQLLENPESTGGMYWSFLQNFYKLIGIPLTFTSLLCLMIILFLMGQVFIFIKKKQQIVIQTNITFDIKNKIFEKAIDVDISFHHNENSGQFINAIIRESEYAGTAVFSLAELITDILFIITYAFLLLYLSVEITVICVIISVTSIIFVNLLLKKSLKYSKKNVEDNVTQNDFVNERFNILRLIKSSSTEYLEYQKMRGITENFRDNNAQYLIAGAKIGVAFQITIFILAIGTLYFSTIFLKMPLASSLIFLFILVRISSPLLDFNNRRHDLVRFSESYHNIDQILHDLESSKKIATGTKEFTGSLKTIQISHIFYSYDRGNPVLKNISITINKKEFVAFVGASGGGKSTLVDVIMRLIDPESGEVSIDNINLKQFDLLSYHSKIGLVSQEILIFNDSALNNICYGSKQCSLSKAIEAAKIANAHDFINELPAGYYSILGERGVKLSGGQKQRIALARAIYKNPEILILDEATSSLDSESEKIIQDAISNIKKKYTLIVIAHRLSTIENADRIYVLEKGEIVESGTHEELLQIQGYYAKYNGFQHKKL